MNEKTKDIIQKVSLGMVIVGAVGAIATGLTMDEVSTGIKIADGLVIIVGAVISYIFGKKK